jgi:hypothetical protein
MFFAGYIAGVIGALLFGRHMSKKLDERMEDDDECSGQDS